MTAGRKSVSAVKDWCSPPAIIASVKEAFGEEIELDPCSNKNALVKARREYCLPEHPGHPVPSGLLRAL